MLGSLLWLYRAFISVLNGSGCCYAAAARSRTGGPRQVHSPEELELC